MPDYMFLLESRLSPEQRAVLERVQELARSQEMNIYLTGGAVRDLISGPADPRPRFHRGRESGAHGARTGKGRRESRDRKRAAAPLRNDFRGRRRRLDCGGARRRYAHPGAKPDYRFAGITEDLRRRDFSINAIAISLNVQSRGLLLDPTNGLADLERQEVRALSIHAFTNQPIRLIRILRYARANGIQDDRARRNGSISPWSADSIRISNQRMSE